MPEVVWLLQQMKKHSHVQMSAVDKILLESKHCWNFISIPGVSELNGSWFSDSELSDSHAWHHPNEYISPALSPCLSSFSLSSLPLSSMASGNVRVCRSWVQSVIFGCGGGPQLSLGLQGLLLSLNHVTWKTAECEWVSFFLCVCECVCEQ